MVLNRPAGFSRLWAAAGLVAIACLSAILTCEIALRLLWDRPPRIMRLAIHQVDAQLGWRPVPDFTMIHTLYDGYAVTVSTNSRGFRDVEHAVTRSPGMKRVLVLGDSFTFGWGVNNGETFADRLRPSLPGAEVINLGVTGWNVKQYYKALQMEGLAYQPNVVVVALVQNDVSSASIPVAGGRSTGERRDSPAMVNERQSRRFVPYTYDLVRTALVGNRFAYQLLGRIGLVRVGGYESLDDNLRPSLVNYPESLVRDWNETLDDLTAIKRACEAHGAVLLIATIPARQARDRASFFSTIARLSYESADFDLDKPYRELSLFCQRLGIPCINGLAALRDVSADLYLRSDMPLNARGHEEFAKILVRPLTDLLHGRTVEAGY